jgi:hypothetical protein
MTDQKAKPIKTEPVTELMRARRERYAFDITRSIIESGQIANYPAISMVVADAYRFADELIRQGADAS